MAEADDISIVLTKPKPQDLIQCLPLTEIWYLLGVRLGVSEEELETIKMKYSDAQLCMVKMFRIWLKAKNSNYKTLIQTLVDIGRMDAALLLCKYIGKLQGKILIL